MNGTGPKPEREEGGFILVGVVMFMIALTILGLSLFALSSYEAQFFYASQSREQSLQSSESGMEVVKSLLSDASVPSAYRYRLEAAQLAVGQFGITRALAYQALSLNPNDTTSRGPVNWDDSLVIVVSAQVGGEERTVQASYTPTSNKNPYHQLITCGQQLVYNTNQDSHNMVLRGGVWQPVQSTVDSMWTSHVVWPVGRPVDPKEPPRPLANEFVDARLATALSVDGTDFDKDHLPYRIEFTNQTQTPKFYRSPPDPPRDSGKWDSFRSAYEFFGEHDVELRIHGTVVWLVNQGVCFLHKVTVVPDPNLAQPNDPLNPNVLIIVAKANLRDSSNPARGIWFQGGLDNDSTSTKVFLVSEGDISLTQDMNSSSDLDAQAVSIVAGGNVELMGPSSDGSFRVTHAASMNSLADGPLVGALPATTGGSGTTFRFAPYSWLETRLP